MSPAALARDLCAGYAEEARHYARALTLAEQLEATLGRGQSVAPLLGGIGEVLGEVQAVENRLAPLKAHWRATGEKPGVGLATTLDEVADMIRRLHTLVESACLRATQQKDHLVPELDDAIRRRHMRRAYGDVAGGPPQHALGHKRWR
jgi:hypothetical protein